MTISQLIFKEFTELFPTIIGKGKSKLSIDELLHSSNDYIFNKLHNLNEGINHEEKSELISFLKLMEAAEDGYDSKIHYQLKRFSEKYPDHKSFKFFVYQYVLNNLYDNEEITSENLNTIYIGILSENTLVKVTDFLSVSGLGNAILLQNEVNDELVSIIKDAVSKYPKKISFLWIAAQLLSIQEKYKEALNYILPYLEKLESNMVPGTDGNPYTFNDFNIDIDYVDEDSLDLALFQAADLYYKIENHNESLSYADRLIKQYEGIKNKESYFYFDSLIIRLRINMKRNENTAFKKDYTELLGVITDDELLENYFDIIEYAKQHKI